MELKDVTQDNYYSNETTKSFMSFTVYKGFQECEAREIAILNGKFQPYKTSTALLFGNYVHSYFESEEAHNKFIEENKSTFETQKGAPRSETKKAINWIEALKQNTYFKKYYLTGTREDIFTGQFPDLNTTMNIFDTETGGVDWIGKTDSLNLKAGVFGDIKTNENIYKPQQKDGVYTDFIHAYGYITQMAIYQNLIKRKYDTLLTPIIYAVSKSNSQVQAIEIPQDELDNALEEVLTNQRHYADLLQLNQLGMAQPEACGVCDYCISKARTKNRNRLISLNDFNGVVNNDFI